jgi:hypothetical protein
MRANSQRAYLREAIIRSRRKIGPLRLSDFAKPVAGLRLLAFAVVVLAVKRVTR